MSVSLLTLLAILSGAIAICSFVLLICLYRGFSAGPQSVENNAAALRRSLLTKVSWPLIVTVSVFVLPLMTWGLRQKLTLSIKQAGLMGWSCSQFFALQWLVGGCSTVFAWLFCSTAGLTTISTQIWLALLIGVVASTLPRFWLHAQRQSRYFELEKGLPFFLDMVSLGLEAGMNLQTSIQLALDHLLPGPLKEEWLQTIFEIRSGVSRAEAFHRMSQRLEMSCIKQMVNAFIQGESMGLSLGGSIAEFSRQQDQYRLLRSEQLALQAPIKMLFPLAFCIFPCTFLVLGFPVVAQLTGLQ